MGNYQRYPEGNQQHESKLRPKTQRIGIKNLTWRQNLATSNEEPIAETKITKLDLVHTRPGKNHRVRNKSTHKH